MNMLEFLYRFIFSIVKSNRVLFFIPFLSFSFVYLILILSMLFIPYIIIVSMIDFFFEYCQYTDVGNIFIYKFVDIIEYTFFEILLFMLALGIYNNIIYPFWTSTQKESIGELFENFIKHFSHPFLIIVSSMLIVTGFKFIFIKQYEISILEHAASILMMIISISILIKIEKSIIE